MTVSFRVPHFVVILWRSNLFGVIQTW